MMAPDYAHWHGMYEVAERFYMELIPQAREIAHHAEESGNTAGAKAVTDLISDILDRPEHEWFEAQKKLIAEAPENTTTEAETEPDNGTEAEPGDDDTEPEAE